MRRALVAVLVLLAAAAGWSYGGELTFVGAACSGSWRTDLYLSGNSGSAPGPQQVTLTYVPFGGDARQVTVTVEGGAADWESVAMDVVCEQFPGAAGTTGVLVVQAPFAITGWARTWTPPGYGQALSPAAELNYSEPYRVPAYPGGYRCNLLLYNPDSTYAVMTVGDEYEFLEPGEAVILMRVPAGARFLLVSGGRVRATLSLVYEATGDAVTVPVEPIP